MDGSDTKIKENGAVKAAIVALEQSATVAFARDDDSFHNNSFSD